MQMSIDCIITSIGLVFRISINFKVIDPIEVLSIEFYSSKIL